MFFLAGLLGMMALGSVVIASTGEGDDEEDEFAQGGPDASLDGAADGDSDAGAAGNVLTDSLLVPDGDQDATDSNAEAAVDDSDTTLMSDAPVAESGNTDSDMMGDWTVSEAPDASELDLVGGAAEEGGLDDDAPLDGSLFARLGLINLPGLDASGSEADETMIGGSGADMLAGGGGEDWLIGGADADTLDGGAGDDSLSGGSGDDMLSGDAGHDVLLGGLGDDALDAGTGDDALFGHEGADTLSGGLGSDTLEGGAGHDLLSGVQRGAEGADLDSADVLDGGAGDDTFAVGSGDVVYGGDGADLMVLGDWITGDAATLADYDDAEDQLVIVYDDADGAEEPDIEMRLSEVNPEVTEILMDGQLLMTMPTLGAPGLDAVVLVGESVASQMALG